MGKVLTVVITAYNVECWLEETLKSIVDAKLILNEIEVLIVNDGSTDNTAKIAEKYVGCYPGAVCLINKKNGGWGSAINTGIQRTSGKYFKVLDGDDWFDSQGLERVVNELKRIESDVVFLPWIMVNDKTKESNVRDTFWDNETGKLVDILKEKQGYYKPNMHGAIFKTSILKNNNINITENCYYTDSEYIIKSLNCCESACSLKIPLYCYRTNREGQSVSVKCIMSRYKEHETVLKEILTYYNDKISDEKKKFFWGIIDHMTTMQYLCYLRLNPSKVIRRELIQFDEFIKETNFNLYEFNSMRTIKYLRITNFRGYYIAARFQQNKLEKNYKEGIVY